MWKQWLRSRFFWSLSLSLLWFGCASALATADSIEDWSFTSKDYLALRDGGGELRVSDDSAWFPEPMAQNLLRTLRYALAPERKPSVTEGINDRDFFHGHLGCGLPRTEVARQAFIEIKNAAIAAWRRGLGGHSTNPVTVQNQAQLIKEIALMESGVGRILRALLSDPRACPSPTLVYHSFEYEPDDMLASDPRRNIMTPLNGEPRNFRPPVTDPETCDWDSLFYQVMQFDFLVDKEGVVHVTPYWLGGLTRVTGPMSHPEDSEL